MIRNPVGEPIRKSEDIQRSSMIGLKELTKKISGLLNTTNQLKSTKMARNSCSWREGELREQMGDEAYLNIEIIIRLGLG